MQVNGANADLVEALVVALINAQGQPNKGPDQKQPRNGGPRVKVPGEPVATGMPQKTRSEPDPMRDEDGPGADHRKDGHWVVRNGDGVFVYDGPRDTSADTPASALSDNASEDPNFFNDGVKFIGENSGCLSMALMALLLALASLGLIKGCHTETEGDHDGKQSPVASAPDDFEERIPVEKTEEESEKESVTETGSSKGEISVENPVEKDTRPRAPKPHVVFAPDVVEDAFKALIRSSFQINPSEADKNTANLVFSKKDRKVMVKNIEGFFDPEDLAEAIYDKTGKKLDRMVRKVLNKPGIDIDNRLHIIRGILVQYGLPELEEPKSQKVQDQQSVRVGGQSQVQKQDQTQGQTPKQVGKGQDQKRRQKAKRARSGK